MGINTDAVQRLYVAYFNRPSDPIGQAYWESKLPATAATQAQLASIAAGFSGSAEYAALYAGQSNAQIVNNLYLNLFGRSAEPAGLTSWANALTNGTQTFASIALQLTYSAQGTDATAIANKLSAANSFTNSLVTTAQITGYSGTAAAASARTWLATVTDVASTLTSATATATLNAAVTSATAAGTSSTGTTFTLTTGADSITGTSGNDTINGSWSTSGTGVDTGTFNSSDIITGNGGTDTLSLRVTGLTGATDVKVPVITNISNIYVGNVDAGAVQATLNMNSVTGTVTNLGLQNSSGTSAITYFAGAALATTFVMDNAKGEMDVNISGTRTVSTTGTNTVNLTVANGTGTSTVPAKEIFVTSAGVGNADNTLNVMKIATAGTASVLDLRAGTSVNTLTVTGTATGNATTGFGLTLTDGANAFGAVTRIDASGMTGTGGLNITATDSLVKTFVGSANNDRFVLGGGVANYNTTDSISFGLGTDTLGFGTDTTEQGGAYTSAKLTALNLITGLENIEFTAANFTALKANDFTAANNFVISGGDTLAGAKVVITGDQTVNNFTFTANEQQAAVAAGSGGGAAGADGLLATGAAVGTTLNIGLAGSGITFAGEAGQAGAASGNTGGAGGNAFTFGGNITTLAVSSTGTGAETIIGGAGGAATGSAANSNGGVAIANGTAVQSMTITGSQALTIAGGAAGTGGAGAAGAAGAGFSGAINVNATSFTGKLTLTGSTGNDIISDGSGGSILRGFGGQDTFNLGSGVDQINLQTAADSNTAATASTISGFTAGQDKIVTTTAVSALKFGSAYTAVGTGVLATDLASAITAGGGVGGANAADLVTITGSGAGTYLVIDANGNGAYGDGGADVVVKMVGLSGTLALTDFATAFA